MVWRSQQGKGLRTHLLSPFVLTGAVCAQPPSQNPCHYTSRKSVEIQDGKGNDRRSLSKVDDFSGTVQGHHPWCACQALWAEAARGTRLLLVVGAARWGRVLPWATSSAFGSGGRRWWARGGVDLLLSCGCSRNDVLTVQYGGGVNTSG